MKKIKFLSLSLFFLGVVVSQAQDLNEVLKAIDSEKYQKAKNDLKSLVESNPDRGDYFFHLGNIYLTLEHSDSAKIYFDKGVTAKNQGHFNHIGLGQIELDNENSSAAQANFDKAAQSARRRSTDEWLYIGRAYLGSRNPDYKKAIESLEKAAAINSKVAEIHLSLGDAHFGDGNVNEAYRSYREALSLDANMLKAKLQMGVITKNAQAFSEAATSFNDIVASSPEYGPVYRELAETYNRWGVSEPAKYQEYNQKALEYYRQYMDLTDYSLDSRMRYADFLILARDYESLEEEAGKMQELANVNPRIFRYLGYAAFHNGNFRESVDALDRFLSKADPFKIIGSDYLYMGRGKVELSKAKLPEETDIAQLESALEYLRKAVDEDPELIGEISKLAIELYEKKSYNEAAIVFLESAKDKESKTYALDNYYLGNAILFDVVNNNKLGVEDEAEKQAVRDWLAKADRAYANVVEFSPTTHDAHLNRAKINRLIDTEEAIDQAIASYEEYIKVVNEKGEAELAKRKTQSDLLASHTFLGAYYAEKDKNRAIENFEEALALVQDEELKQYITESLEVLKQ